MHARKAARDAYFPAAEDDRFWAGRPRWGDVTFADSAAAREFTARLNDARAHGSAALSAAEVAAMSLLHEVFHAVIGVYRAASPGAFTRLGDALGDALGNDAEHTLRSFVQGYPVPEVYSAERGDHAESVDAVTERILAPNALDASVVREELTEEIVLLWVLNQNPALAPVRDVIADDDFRASCRAYGAFVDAARRFFASPREAKLGENGEDLVELLLAPSRAAPASIFDQLSFVQERWGRSFGLDRLPLWRRILWTKDFLREEGKWFTRGGPGPGSPLLEAMRFGAGGLDEGEPKRFSEDKGWMPRVVLIAKSVYVWLAQLSETYGRPITRLDQIPDEELDLLRSRGFTGLWLIGLFERSRASRRLKQMRGDHDALASAYSLRSYDIAEELGGYFAYANLRDRAWARQIRLAADMVPNHVGVDGDWVMNHPDWFLSATHPPFPAYRFGGPDLSDDSRAGVFIEEGYWDSSDAAVVFRRHDRHTGQDRFIYHGNDGTSMPWNDTAQLDYTKAEVREAVVQTILHVARMFPIIRFDAAMTLAKRHYQRLWFPLPGTGGAIPSRSDYAMTQEEFDAAIPVEFWREVVDTVAERAPETLLLAEAFWMMEGYFVRSLGMHRVYNSAFMNMLKNEENAKYRETIKNVLEFEPKILERFVNFMNNPDEDTAANQFGNDDKYFGVCTLMCTLPGLPMFGHGQVEGLREKYGMEYRRPRSSEEANPWIVARHEREIFPLLERRWLFSGVADFALYDFVTQDGAVDEDVFAFTNRAGNARAFVLYNNKYKRTRGRVRWSVPSKTEEGGTRAPALAEALGIERGRGDWLLFRDLSHGLDYVLPAREIIDDGFAWDLDAFKYHVFSDVRTVDASPSEPYDKLASELAGRGVPSIARALVELRLKPIHRPLVEATQKAHLEWLAEGWDTAEDAPKTDAVKALDERIENMADGLAYMTERPAEGREDAVARARVLYAAVLRDESESESENESENVEATSTRFALAWIQLEAVLDLISHVEPHASREEIVRRYELTWPLLEAFSDQGKLEAERDVALLMLAATLPAEGALEDILRAAWNDARGSAFLGIHEADGVVWLVKERFSELVRAIGEREVVLGRITRDEARTLATELDAIAETEGYRARAIAEALDARSKVLVPPSDTTIHERETLRELPDVGDEDEDEDDDVEDDDVEDDGVEDIPES